MWLHIVHGIQTNKKKNNMRNVCVLRGYVLHLEGALKTAIKKILFLTNDQKTRITFDFFDFERDN